MRMRVAHGVLMVMTGVRHCRRQMIMRIEVADVAMGMAISMFVTAQGHPCACGNSRAVMMSSRAKKHGRSSKPLHRKCKDQQAYQDDAQAFEHDQSVEQSNGDWFNLSMSLWGIRASTTNHFGLGSYQIDQIRSPDTPKHAKAAFATHSVQGQSKHCSGPNDIAVHMPRYKLCIVHEMHMETAARMGNRAL